MRSDGYVEVNVAGYIPYSECCMKPVVVANGLPTTCTLCSKKTVPQWGNKQQGASDG